MIYPLSTIGAHVSDCPNHTVGRVTPFETRGIVAMAGTFGYELDITRISEEDRSMIPCQIETYHKYSGLCRKGDYYRLASYAQNHYHDAYMVVSKDRSEALVTYVQVLGRPNCKSARLKLKGLDADAIYRADGDPTAYSGGALMYAGINIRDLFGDARARLIHFSRV